MTDTIASTHACSGSDTAAAQRVLAEVVAEMNQRQAICTETDTPQWSGPDLHLVVDEVHRVGSDEECARMLDHILRCGRKLGVTGVARGPERYEMPSGVNDFTRTMLMEGRPLRFEASA